MANEPAPRLHLLGGFTLAIADRTVAHRAWRLRRARDVVKLLALAPGRRLQRDQVLELLWPDKGPEAATNNLHQALYAARRAIASAGGDGHASLVLSSETLQLCPDDDLWIDAAAFERAGREALEADTPETCRAALNLYTGPLLPDDRYADWVQPHRELLHQLHLDVTADLARHLERSGDLSEAADLLRQLLLESPTHEAAHRHLMRVYALAGDRSAAARQFDRLETVLREELGVIPDDRSQALADDIAAGRLPPSPVTSPEPPAPVGTEAGRRSNLPTPLSTFVGRARELDEFPGLVTRHRLVSLVGPGGCGKTRLAIEVGRRCLDAHDGGVFLVPLATVTESVEVGLEIAHTLDTRAGPEETTAEAVARRIGATNMVLVLDNCEHVIDAAARAAASLLAACPHLTVLATSREPLRVPGEVVRRVSSLDVPDPKRLPEGHLLTRFDGIRLFTERVRAVQAGFEVTDDNAADVAEVCFRLDGMPLALELAATRVPALSVAGTARKLDDRFRLLRGGPRTALTRQQTLEATVEWSYDLLAPREQALFRRLATVHGPFDLAAAEALAGSAVPTEDVAPVLSELVARSMVVAEPGEGEVRHRLLETMRAYGLARLRHDGELADARAAHARWIRALARPTSPDAVATARTRWMSRLAAVHDDLRPALDQLASTRPTEAVRLAARLWPYWLWHAHLGEGLELLERVVGDTTEPSSARAEALVGASALAVRWKGFEAMADYAERALGEARTLDDPHLTSRALLFSMLGPWCRDDHEDAEARLDEARAIARAAGLAADEVGAIMALATVAAEHRELEAARDLLHETEDLLDGLADDDRILSLYTLGSWMPTRRRGEQLLMWSETWVDFEETAGRSAHANVLAARGNLERLAGRTDAARDRLDEALVRYRSADDVSGEALVLTRMGQVALAVGDLDRAHRDLETSLHLRERIGNVRAAEASLVSLARVAGERGDHEAAHAYLDRAAALARQHLDRIVLGPILIEQAVLALDAGHPAMAARQLLPEALAIGREAGYSIHRACVLRDLGQAQAQAGMADAATASLSEAMQAFDDRGRTQEVAHCRRLLAALA